MKSTRITALLLAAASLATFANAAAVTWDITPGTIGAGDSAITGGTGTWNDSLSGAPNGNWTTDGGANNIAWVNANNDTAIFGGTAGTVTLGNAISVGGLTFNTGGYNLTGSSLTFNGAGSITTVATGLTATIDSALIGGGRLNKSGAGTLVLSGANTFSGGTELTGGVLSINSVNALGTGYLAIKNSAVLRYTGTGSEKLATGTLWFDNTPVGIEVVDTGAVLTLWRTAGTHNQQMIKTGDGTLRYGANGDNNGASATINAGVLESISSANNNFGNVTVNAGGTFRLGTVDGAGNAITADHQIWNGGTLTVNSGGAFDMNGMTETVATTSLAGTGIAGGGALFNNSTTASTLGGIVALGTNATIGGTGNITLTGNITGANSLTKIGAGTLTLTGTPNHTGGTNIFAGTLAIDSASASTLAGALTGAGTLSKTNSGTLTLTGGGSFSGTLAIAGGAVSVNGTLASVGIVNVASGATLAVGGAGSLTAGSINFAGTGSLTFGTLANYTGGAAFTSSDFVLSGGVGSVTLNLGTGVIAANTYRLISHGGSLDDASGFVIGTGPTLGARQNGGLVYSAGSIDYIVTGDTLKWTGAESSEWSTAAIAGSKNWDLATAGTATDYLEGDIVRFDDTATGTTVNIAANIAPTSTVFDNTTKDYTLSGSAGIAGSTSLTKSGTGTLSISAQNSYTGGTTLNAGTLAITDAASLGAQSGALTFAGNATLRTLGSFSTTRAVTLNTGVVGTIDTNGFNLTQTGAISGSGALVKTGAGTLTLGTQNTYTGGTTVNAGVLDLAGGGGQNGTIRGTVTVNTDATLRLSVNDATGWGGGANAITTINLVGGTLHVNTTTNQTLASAVINMTGATISGIANSNIDLFGNGSAINTLASANESVISLPTMNLRQNNTTFTVADGAAARDLVISSNLGNGDAGNHNLIKAGAGNMVLTGTNGYTGSTAVNAGTLTVTGTTNGTNGITVNGGANLVVATGGTLTSTGALGTAVATGANITVESGATLNLASAAIAWNTGTFKVDGTMNVTGDFRVSTNATTNLTGTGTINAANFTTGNASGTVFNSAVATVNLSGAVLIGDASIAGYGNTFTQSAGTINAGGLQLGYANTTAAQTYNLTGGTLNLGANGISALGSDSRNINLGAGTLGATASWSTTQSVALTNAATGTIFNTADAVNGLTGRTISLAGIVSGVGKLNKVGAGTLVLSAANTYTGGTTILGGTLVTAAANALGAGSVNVTGGTLQIGDGANNSVTLGSGANLVINAGGTLTLGGANTTITLVDAGGFTLAGSTLDLGGFFDHYTESTYQLITGGSGAKVGGATVTGYDSAMFSAVALNDNGLLVFTAIPEPSTYGLIGAGALGAVALVRRRRQAKLAE